MPSKTNPHAARASAMRGKPWRIGRKGPPIGEVMGPLSSASSLVDYGALDADPQSWFTTMQCADRGDTGRMIDVFNDAIDRDAHLRGVNGKRVQSLTGRPVIVRPPDGYENDHEAIQAAQLTRRIILSESRHFRSRIAHLMTGASYGYSVGKIRWSKNSDSMCIPHIEEVALNRFAYTREGLQIGFYDGPYRSSWKVCPLADYPDQFVVHMPLGGRSDYPWRRGPIRSCIIPSFCKRNGLKFLLTLAERFGMPMPYARVGAGIDDDDESEDNTVRTVRAALASLSRHWSMVVGRDVEIDTIPGSGETTGEAHKVIIDWAETTQSIAMLGQNLTTKVEGGSFAAAEAHRYVAGDIHLADSVELGETVTDQICEPIIRYNMPGAPVPVFEISTGQKQVPDLDDVEAGVFSPDERRRALGHDAQPDGKGADYRRPTTVQVPEKLEPEAEAVDVEIEEPVAGETIETEAPAADEATAKDPATGLNGAQVDALKQIVIDVSLGTLPKPTAEALILAAFPISKTQVDSILGPIVPATPAAPAPEPAPAPT